MADISSELSEILTAERGEDVRMSIYRGLQKMSNQIQALLAVIGGGFDPATALELIDLTVTDLDATTADIGTLTATGASVAHDLSVGGNFSVVGNVSGSVQPAIEVLTNTTSVAITSNNTPENPPAIGGNLTLQPGKYILIGRFVFGTGATEGARTNQIAIYTGSNPTYANAITASIVRVAQASKAWASLVTCTYVHPEEETLYTVGGTSSMETGDAQPGASMLYAIKIA